MTKATTKPSEFTIITDYFTQHVHINPAICLGSGDDCALMTVPPDHVVAITTDTLIAGVHFPVNTAPEDIGHKALAVSLSDLAAMGAEPIGFTGALTLTDVEPTWLTAFSQGMARLATQFNTQLMGGDLTHGPVMSITITAHGFVPKHQALYRHGAKSGDVILVTGELGGAGFALQVLQNPMTLADPVKEKIMARLHRPQPQIAAGLALRGIANSAIDISDGLLQDLQHILDASNVGANINVASLPISPSLREHLAKTDAIRLAATAGDDYELVFTVPPIQLPALQQAMQQCGCQMTRIGEITPNPGLHLLDEHDQPYDLPSKGYDHFR